MNSPGTDDDGRAGVGHASAGFATAQGVRQMAGRTPAAGGRLPLGKAVGQGWALFLAGLLAVIGGLALLVNPGSGLRLVKWTLGLFLVGWGVLRLVHAFSGPRRDRTWLVLSGLCILGAGIVVLVWPDVTVTALLYILVVGGLCLASVDLVGAVVDRRRNPSWWLQLLRGPAGLAGRDPGGGPADRRRAAAAVGRLHHRGGLPVAHPRRPARLPRPDGQGDPAPAHLTPPGQGTVSGSGPSSSTATVCSKWAAREPSRVATAQPSGRWR
jgi:uncharacterized membrane protein HdeD (DUF308 family)